MHLHELILVRHGQTLHNALPKDGKFLAPVHGSDPRTFVADDQLPLTARGQQEARLVGQRLRHLAPFDFYYSSGYVRGLQTLDGLLSAFPPDQQQASKRRTHLFLRERDPGYTHWMTSAEVDRHFPWYRDYATRVGPFYAVPPGGQSIADICTQVHSFLRSLRRAKAGRRVLIVTHGRIMLAFRFWLARWPADQANVLFDPPHLHNCDALRYHSYNSTTHRFVEEYLPFNEANS